MKLLQIPSCVAVMAAPYWILYTRTPLKDNFNNTGLATRAFGYYILATCIKVFIMASGVPEYSVGNLLSEKLMMSIFNCLMYLGLAIVIKAKTTTKVNSANIILGSGLGWSMPENLGRLIFELIKCYKQMDHSESFLYTAVETNLFVLASIVFSAIFFMWQREKEGHSLYTIMTSIAMILFPIMSTYNDMHDGEPGMDNFTFLAFQGVLAYIFAVFVRHRYMKTNQPNKGS